MTDDLESIVDEVNREAGVTSTEGHAEAAARLIQSARRERDEAQRSEGLVLLDLEVVKGERDAARKALEGYGRSIQEVTHYGSECLRLAVERDAALRERDEAQAKGHDIETALCRRLDALVTERDAALAQVRELESGNVARLDKQTALRGRQREEALAEVREYDALTDKLLKHAEEYAERIATLEADLDRASREHEAYITQLGVLEALLAEARKQGEENARLRAVFEKIAADERALSWHPARWIFSRLRAALAADSSEGEGK